MLKPDGTWVSGHSSRCSHPVAPSAHPFVIDFCTFDPHVGIPNSFIHYTKVSRNKGPLNIVTMVNYGPSPQQKFVSLVLLTIESKNKLNVLPCNNQLNLTRPYFSRHTLHVFQLSTYISHAQLKMHAHNILLSLY